MPIHIGLYTTQIIVDSIIRLYGVALAFSSEEERSAQARTSPTRRTGSAQARIGRIAVLDSGNSVFRTKPSRATIPLREVRLCSVQVGRASKPSQAVGYPL